jgi:biotin carboxyl carrier protein
MNNNEIKKFLQSIRDTDIEEMEYESGETSIYIKKNEVTQKIETQKKVVVEKKNTIVPIKSTMVGTFYNAPAHDRPPFVVEGSHIESGQKIGAIEAMKIIKDVIATTKGKIVKISVKNGQSVEYGQELFLVDTSNEE